MPYPCLPGARHWSIFLELAETAGAQGNALPDAYRAGDRVRRGVDHRRPGVREVSATAVAASTHWARTGSAGRATSPVVRRPGGGSADSAWRLDQLAGCTSGMPFAGGAARSPVASVIGASPLSVTSTGVRLSVVPPVIRVTSTPAMPACRCAE
jgi:hypothetical protein